MSSATKTNHIITLNTNTPTRVSNTTLQQTSSSDVTPVSNTIYNSTSWTTQHALSSHHRPIITTINIRHDLQTTTKPTNLYKLQECRLDTIYERHRVRIRSDHNTYCQYNFHKQYPDGR